MESISEYIETLVHGICMRHRKLIPILCRFNYHISWKIWTTFDDKWEKTGTQFQCGHCGFAYFIKKREDENK